VGHARLLPQQRLLHLGVKNIRQPLCTGDLMSK
jgi:hypothetical protein